MWRPYLDSLLGVYPKMTDASAYQELRKKATLETTEKFQYLIKVVPISHEKFNQFVKLINESGYWNMEKESWCKYVPTDAAYFTLEANTPKQFKIVGSPSCENDYRKFTKICQAIVDAAGYNKEIQLIWDGGTKTLDDTLKIPEVPINQPKNEHGG